MLLAVEPISAFSPRVHPTKPKIPLSKPGILTLQHHSWTCCFQPRSSPMLEQKVPLMVSWIVCCLCAHQCGDRCRPCTIGHVCTMRPKNRHINARALLNDAGAWWAFYLNFVPASWRGVSPHGPDVRRSGLRASDDFHAKHRRNSVGRNSIH